MIDCMTLSFFLASRDVINSGDTATHLEYKLPKNHILY